MRWHVGPPPRDELFDPAPPWRRLREPRQIAVSIMLSLPLGLLAALAILVLGAALAPQRQTVLVFSVRFLPFVAFVLAVVAVHELLHAVTFPGSLRSPHVVLGFWPRALLFYAHYSGELSRERFLLTLICPFAVMSAASLLLSTIDPAHQGLWLSAGAFNAFASSMDLFGFVLIAIQVPRGARLRNQGSVTYWKPA
ncbi:DUF3267 domain-containing protein [Thermomicrobiaceae bacterium CFH 74404]|uniref:DUF3267 domain-containing protein n=1 Tax=Thermalbibacter longus TaxID=2951981 RepID=A0AA42BAY0_9BACT|nr:DUF3267 domain-containing protein [Thermalbibacter longus]MCM8750346.1 DUF3267 domain-containing protein [Thermalbibacter longus]